MTNEEYLERIEKVSQIQKEYGMKARQDSEFTKMFARGELTISADEVARELVCVDYIYTNTLYGEFIEDYMKELANSIKKKYKLTWTETWKIVRFYGPDSLKLLCLLSAQQRLPTLCKVSNKT